MRKSCGRTEAKVKNQMRQIQNSAVFGGVRLPSADYYNRLDCKSATCSFLLEAQFMFRFPAMTAMAYNFGDTKNLGNNYTPRAYLSLARGRKSCDKQHRGGTPFRRGMA
jgi:hypothetical protein